MACPQHLKHTFMIVGDFIPFVFFRSKSLDDFCCVCSVNMEESHAECQKLGAEKGLSPCAGRAVLRVTVVSASCYVESCAYLKSIDQTCRQWASTGGLS